MARCPECNKFVSYGEMEVEIQSEDYCNGEVTIELRAILPCADCGEELKEIYSTLEREIECPNRKSTGRFNANDYEDEMPIIANTLKPGEKFAPDANTKYFEDEDETFEYFEAEYADTYECFGDVKPNGKVVNLKKHYYGVNICPSFHCKVCGHDFHVELKEEFLPTDMEDLV